MGHANRHRRPSRAARRLAAAGVVSALCTVPLTTATASQAQAAEGDKTAVVGPLLDFFGFGTSIGAPVFCGTTSAAIGSGFQEFNATEQGNALVVGINEGCALFSEQGTAFVEQGKVAQAPYAEAFNPFANPAIGQLGDAVTTFGTDFEPALAPFGPTIAGSGKTIKFFQGTMPEGS